MQLPGLASNRESPNGPWSHLVVCAPNADSKADSALLPKQNSNTLCYINRSPPHSPANPNTLETCQQLAVCGPLESAALRLRPSLQPIHILSSQNMCSHLVNAAVCCCRAANLLKAQAHVNLIIHHLIIRVYHGDHVVSVTTPSLEGPNKQLGWEGRLILGLWAQLHNST